MNKFKLQILLNADNFRIFSCENKESKIQSLLYEYRYAVKIQNKYQCIDVIGENKYLYSCLKELSSYYTLEIL